MIEIKFKKMHPDAKTPTKVYEDAACWDLYAIEDKTITRGHGAVVDVGLALELPPGWMALIYTRSGHGFKNMRAHLGVIDADYRGDISPYISNSNCASLPLNEDKVFRCKKGDRVAQIFFQPVPKVTLTEVEEFTTTTARGEKGHGSSGN